MRLIILSTFLTIFIPIISAIPPPGKGPMPTKMPNHTTTPTFPEGNGGVMDPWPREVVAASVVEIRRVGGYETNGELLRRGAKINKPRKLYQTEKKATIFDKRINGSPAQATASRAPGSTKKYVFVGCYSEGLTGGTQYNRDHSIPSQDPTAIANGCAIIQDSIRDQPGVIQGFVILQSISRFGTLNCETSITALSNSRNLAVTCSESNFAAYILQD